MSDGETFALSIFKKQFIASPTSTYLEIRPI